MSGHGTEVLLFRHGATAGNLEHRYIGRTDEAVLPDALAALRARGREVSSQVQRIFVSPLLRCRQSAEALFPGQEVTVVPGFSECDFGAFEYRNYQELSGNADYQRFIDSGGESAFPGGESRAEFERRVCRAFTGILGELSALDCAALVVHGGTIMALVDAFSVPHRGYWDAQLRPGEGVSVRLETDAEGRPALCRIRPLWPGNPGKETEQ